MSIYKIPSFINHDILYQAINCSNNGVVISDANQPDIPIIYVNPAFVHMTGYQIDEILNKNCRFLQGNDRSQPAIHKIREALKNKTDITTIIRNYRKDGIMFWNELTISPVFNEQKQLTHFIGIQNDVSARKEAERQVNEFYSVVSHELKTPLSSIISTLSIILEEKEVSKENLKLISIAKSASNKLRKLIDDILDFKKIEYGTDSLNLSDFKIKNLIDIVLEDFTAILHQKNIKIICQIHSNTSIQIDSDKIIRVLSNLISNAIKFSHTNSKIIIKVNDYKNDMVSFSIQDFGIGIEKNKIDNLFKPFSVLGSNIIDTTQTSSGLGLYICKSLIELHDGTISVESTINSGSTFTFTLPKKLV